MTPRGRLGLAAALTVVVMAATPTTTQAYSCTPVVAVPGATRPGFDREVAIISATVVEKSFKGTVTLDVLQVWKGELTQQITMLDGWFGGTGATTTDWPFELGQTYLIFGLGDSIETMRAEKCTLTARLEDADKTLELLKAAGYSPRLPQIAPPNR